MPLLAYADDIINIVPPAQCPPANATDTGRTCFRYVFIPMNGESFIPVGKKNPRRMHGKDSEIVCSMLALSMFDTDKQARDRYKFIKKSISNIGKCLGTHLATGTLQDGDGLSTPSQVNGHFDFHPGKGLVVHSRFAVVGII